MAFGLLSTSLDRPSGTSIKLIYKVYVQTVVCEKIREHWSAVNGIKDFF